MRWVFIGAGNMASSLIGGLIASDVSPQQVDVIDPNKDACQRARERFGICTPDSLASLLANAGDMPLGLVLAVKPPVVEIVCREFNTLFEALDSRTQTVLAPLFISVAAGVRASSMEAWLPSDTPLVRCMPNTPSLLGLGATGLYANTACSNEQRTQAQSLLDSAGITLWVDDESQLDAITALSGSGPAYFFYLIEQMAAAGQKLGLDADTASTLAIETAFGAASMARTREHTPSTLRQNVTSKGGTTAAALQVFDERHLPATVLQAMQAAHNRAVELGDQLTTDVRTLSAQTNDKQ